MKPNRIIKKKSSLNGLLALGLLTTGLATGFSLGVNLENKNTKDAIEVAKKSIQENVKLKQENIRLTSENKAYEKYSETAARVAGSMTFYPTNMDGISALPDAEQEKAEKRALAEDAKEKKKIDDAIKTLGIDQKDLATLKRGVFFGRR
ncbi:MAG: hypothetical protein E7021_00985 [Alphaproteobacteria bacterium]|nr:hypothetical protein [Alphaproteobacteria bacterium]